MSCITLRFVDGSAQLLDNPSQVSPIARGQLGVAIAPNPSYTAHFTTHSTGIRVTLLQRLSRDVERNRRMNAQELRDKTPDQLRDELANLKKEAFNLRFQQATGQLENASRLRGARRDAARVKTILNEQAAKAAE